MALPVITFYAPIAGVFTALWRSNDRSFERKVGVFDAPGIIGSVAQDKGPKSVKYTITCWFTGTGFETAAEGFFQALRLQPGQWTVLHPEKGLLRLQLLSAREGVDPIGDVTGREFELEFMQPAITNPFLSAVELATAAVSIIGGAVNAVLTLANTTKKNKYSAVLAATTTASSVSASAVTNLQIFAVSNSEAAETFSDAAVSISTQSTNWLNDPTDIDALLALMQAIIDLMSIPSSLVDNYSTVSAAYNTMIDEFISIVPGGVTDDDYNAATMLELSLVAVMIAYSQMILASTFKTRSEVVIAIDGVASTFSKATNQLEEIQKNFLDNDIDDQYIALSTVYSEIQKLFTLVNQYLMTEFFNLSAEIFYTTTDWESPLVITALKYGSFGDNDENYTLFLESNNLTGDDVLLLPPGTEYVIYG